MYVTAVTLARFPQIKKTKGSPTQLLYGIDFRCTFLFCLYFYILKVTIYLTMDSMSQSTGSVIFSFLTAHRKQMKPNRIRGITGNN